MLLVCCKNSTKKITFTKTSTKDTISTTITKAYIKAKELPEIKNDSIKKVSKPFELNNILCYWENYILDDEIIHLNLKDYKTKQKLLSTSMTFADFDAVGIKIELTSDDLFYELNNKFFEDLNFDGLKDFSFYGKGSTAMTSLTNIYLFNNGTKSFEDSEYLNATSIDQIDRKNRILITTNFESDFEETKRHYFDKLGKLKYTEIITTSDSIVNDTSTIYKKIYQKLINGKVVKTKEYITNE